MTSPHSTLKPIRLLPGLTVARRLLLDVHANEGGQELALLALEIAIAKASEIEATGAK